MLNAKTILYVAVLIASIPAFVSASNYPPGFQESEIANGTSAPISLELVPDGRFFVCEQGGNVRVIKNGALLPQPMLSLSVVTVGQRGLQSLALDPSFATNGHFYVVYTVASGTHNVLSRFTASGDTADPNSEVQLFQFDLFSGSNAFGVTSLAVGPDGKLYMAIGDTGDPGESSPNAQSMSSIFGKVLRLNLDGSIPTDNPFYNSASGIYRAIWALGLRNPYTMAFQPGTGRFFINDVDSETFEEINEGAAGANYGYPNVTGNSTNPQFTNPFYCYPYGSNATSNGRAITGGAFYNPAQPQFPDSFTGCYFFMDYVNGWINFIDLNNGNTVNEFGSLLGADVVYLKVGPDGSLYYINRGDGGLRRIQYLAPILMSQPQNQSVTAGNSATFSVTVRAAAAYSCQWLVNGSVIPGANATTYTTPATAGSDNGNLYTVVVSNGSGSVTSTAATLTVSAPPAITTPASASPNPAGIGETVTFLVGASDSDGDALSYAWNFGDGSSGSGSTTTHVYNATGVYAVSVTVTDSAGLSVSSSGLNVNVLAQAPTQTSSPSTSPSPSAPFPPPPPPAITPNGQQPLALSISAVKGSVRLNASGHDTLTITGTLPNLPKLLNPSGQTLLLNASSASVSFTLNSKGQGHTSQGVFAMNLKPVTLNKQTHTHDFQGGNVTFSVRLKNGAWAAAWGIEATTANGPLNFSVQIQLNGAAYLGSVAVKYSAKSGTGGTFKN